MEETPTARLFIPTCSRIQKEQKISKQLLFYIVHNKELPSGLLKLLGWYPAAAARGRSFFDSLKQKEVWKCYCPFCGKAVWSGN